MRQGVVSAMLGGVAYGTCVIVGVTFAYVFVARPTWGYTEVRYCLLAQFAAIVFCGAVMIPAGFLAGLIYTLYNWRRAEQCVDDGAGESTFGDG